MLFKNARHSAITELVVDGAGVKYAFGLNLLCRLATDPLSGSWAPGTWANHSGGYRYFFIDSTYTDSGAWVVHTVGREWGPIEVSHLRRTGTCACEKTGGCKVKQQQTRKCGVCGTQTRTCGGYCNWGSWATCKECPGADGGATHVEGGTSPGDNGVDSAAAHPDGATSKTDLSTKDAGHAAGGLSGGCGCQTLGSGDTGGASLALPLLLLLGLLTRRSTDRTS